MSSPPILNSDRPGNYTETEAASSSCPEIIPSELISSPVASNLHDKVEGYLRFYSCQVS